jgi:RNA polymerase sigma factor (sigma-70 family)
MNSNLKNTSLKSKTVLYHSDLSVWKAFKEGNVDAYEIIFLQYYPDLLNYGLIFNSDPHDVKDCVQQLFVNLWETRERLADNNSIKPYLMTSLKRMILRKAKSQMCFMEIDSVAKSGFMENSVECDFIYYEEQVHQKRKMKRLVNNLSKRQKKAIQLKFYNDYDFNNIAMDMEISTRAVYKLIYKALGNLSGAITNENSEVYQLL